MIFSPPLKSGTLVKRYKRFLADIRLNSGQTITVHCPNSGAMTGCSTPGSLAYFSRSDNPKRKYPHTLELVQEGDTLIGVNTSRTNHIVAEALEKRMVPELADFDTLKREVKTSDSSRLDLMLSKGEEKIYIEVKNCSLVQDGIAMFPDAVTARGTKHLLELARLHEEGHRTVIFFLVQRTDATTFRPAFEVDPLYSKTLYQVQQQGVEVLAYQAGISPEKIELGKRLPFTTDGAEL